MLARQQDVVPVLQHFNSVMGQSKCQGRAYRSIGGVKTETCKALLNQLGFLPIGRCGKKGVLGEIMPVYMSGV